MSERQIRDAFTYGAGEFQARAELWSKIEGEIAARQASRLRLRRIWQRVAVAAAALVLAGSLLLGTSEQARALVERIKVIWSGEVAGRPATVGTFVPDPSDTIWITPQEAKDLAEAEAKSGLKLPVIETKDLIPLDVSYAVTAGLAPGSELRLINQLYWHESSNSSFNLSKEGYYVDGKKQPLPRIGTLWSPQTQGIEQRTVGDALCSTGHIGEGSPTTRCQLVEDDFLLEVGGTDQAVVEAVIKAMQPAKQTEP